MPYLEQILVESHVPRKLSGVGPTWAATTLTGHSPTGNGWGDVLP